MAHPPHLDPSPLGTKEYWESYYQDRPSANPAALEDSSDDPTEDSDGEQVLESWFSESRAPSKILAYLTSPTHIPLSSPSTLDIGAGNGSMLFSLVSSGCFDPAALVGIDYSTSSVALARRLAIARGVRGMRFEVCDVLAARPVGGWAWVPDGGFDLVLDKGTFDAMSLNEETYVGADGAERRVCEMYPGIVAGLVRKGGWAMITSCNWTEEEVVQWFAEGTGGELEVWGKVEYPKFRFGGVDGQGVASVCFKRKEGSEAVDLR